VIRTAFFFLFLNTFVVAHRTEFAPGLSRRPWVDDVLSRKRTVTPGGPAGNRAPPTPNVVDAVVMDGV